MMRGVAPSHVMCLSSMKIRLNPSIERSGVTKAGNNLVLVLKSALCVDSLRNWAQLPS